MMFRIDGNQTPIISISRRRFLASTAAAAIALSAPGRLQADNLPSLKVLFFGGAMPEVQTDLQAKYALEVRKGGSIKNREQDNVEGLEHLADVDLWIGSANKRTFPSDEQLAHFKKYLASGKPFVGYRAASHVFQNWLEADQAVFGAKYGGHHLLNKEEQLVIRPADGALEHPILKVLEIPKPLSGSYKYTELSLDVKVLLYSGVEGDFMPHTWVREIDATKNRVFYTRYDSKQIAREPAVRAIFIRGIRWALGHELS